MKKINSLKVSFIILAIFFAVGCSKDKPTSPPSGGGGPTVTPAAIPYVNVTKADTGLYNGSALVVFSTNGQLKVKDGNAITGNQFTVYGLTKDSVITIEATTYSSDGKESKTASITFIVKCWSPKTTQLNNYAPLHFLYAKRCVAGTENDPNTVWTDVPFPCDSYDFNANGSGSLIWGICRITPGYVIYSSNAWLWYDSNENSINFGVGDVYNVTFMPNGIKRTKTNNGFFYKQELVE